MLTFMAGLYIIPERLRMEATFGSKTTLRFAQQDHT